MIFTETPLAGAWLLDLEPHRDERGFFARTFCSREFAEHGLETTVAQTNTSFNRSAGTLRGMHFQLPPAGEAKLVRCVAGAIYDAIVDLRAESDTYLHAFGTELSAENRRALYIPPRFAHGYLTLADATEIHYQVSEFYTPGLERGFRFDDPAVDIDWPREPDLVSTKDLEWSPLDATDLGRELVPSSGRRS